ncbi:MAG: hypothetical protein SFU85_04800 [Candidatus Methylacidiphilales bacterium]|nr:hypothetical protein [Candidatus Methylacidiphilales bacterium]
MSSMLAFMVVLTGCNTNESEYLSVSRIRLADGSAYMMNYFSDKKITKIELRNIRVSDKSIQIIDQSLLDSFSGMLYEINASGGSVMSIEEYDLIIHYKNKHGSKGLLRLGVIYSEDSNLMIRGRSVDGTIIGDFYCQNKISDFLKNLIKDIR